MGRARGASSDYKLSREERALVLSDDPVLRDLAGQFERFYRDHAPGSRIPIFMREAVLDALRQGVPRVEVQRACSLRSTQLALWKKSHTKRSQSVNKEEVKARIFSVSDAEAIEPPTSVGPGSRDELELRFCGWSICIRPLEGQDGA